MYEAKFAGGQRTRMASERTNARGTRSLPQRDTRLAETLVRAATDGATTDERAAISLAQRWTVGLLTQLGEPVDEAPWVRMIVAHDSLRAIETLRVGRDQQTARFFMEALHRDWDARTDGTSQLVLRLAPIAVRLAWARVDADTEAAVARTRERLADGEDRGLAEALFSFVLTDRMDRRRARAA
jgi:hypothetical protein